MDYGNLVSLAPLAVLAATAVVAMLMAPFFGGVAVRNAAAFGFLVALILMAERYGDPAAPATDLLADDATARLGAILVTLAGLAVLFVLPARGAAREGPALVAVGTAGAVTLAAALHGATVFLGLEISSLALVALVAFPLSRAALEAGYKYFIMGGAAAAALLFALAIGFSGTGGLHLSMWTGEGALVALSAALAIAAIAFKFSLVPFHSWAPDVFEGAPAGAAAFAGVAAKIAILVLILRLDAGGMPEPLWTGALWATGAASILLGNAVALRQTSLKRMLGWSSVAHTGYAAAILASGADFAGEAALFYLLAYGPALIAAFAAAAAIGPDPQLGDLPGLAARRPLVAGGLALGLVSLSGLPPAVGFVGKVYLFTALAGAGAWVLLAVAAIGASLGFFYYFRFAVAPFMAAPAGRDQAPAKGEAARAEPDAALGAVIVGASLPILAIGFYPGPFMELARAALP